jgi:anaerobic ribonucleoside-triphosphate reductase activating protein
MLRMAGVTWQCYTAGPHEGEGRTEIFCQGCLRAEQGNPCPGCFNPSTWSIKTDQCWKYKPKDLAVLLDREMPNDFLTIGGGEPFLQAKDLTVMLRHLRKLRPDLHVIIYSGYTLKELVWTGIPKYCKPHQARELLELVNTLVDGPFDQERNTWNPEDGYIGSDNQRVYDEIELMHYLDICLD